MNTDWVFGISGFGLIRDAWHLFGHAACRTYQGLSTPEFLKNPRIEWT